jgi:carboxylesterase type B
MRDAGYSSNNGFRDQRTALLFLKQYLSGFGGDPANVTLMGESAGAVSVAYHLHSKKPLFKRAMLMSGTTLLMPPVPPPVADSLYAKLIDALELNALEPERRLESLREADIRDLRAKSMQAGVPSLPVLDGDLIPVAIDWKGVLDGSSQMSGRDWCEGIVIGDCAFDVGH